MAVAVSRRRFTADEYQKMGEAGILREDDRVELIDGEVVAMTPVGPPHNGAINRLNHLFVTLAGDTAIVQVQGSVRLDGYSEPQPDVVLLRPRDDFYASSHAAPHDILLIVEVAQSSLRYDRGVKAALYAKRGVPEYWIVDVADRVVTQYTDPSEGRYRTVRVHVAGETLTPGLAPACAVSTDAIFGR